MFPPKKPPALSNVPAGAASYAPAEPRFPKVGPSSQRGPSGQALAVLVVTPFEEDLLSLREIFDPAGWKMQGARTCHEAVAVLRENPAPILLCESKLPDGDWRDILNESSLLGGPLFLIVTSRLADEYLWAEVLNLGGYDVLLKPFDANEVSRVVRLAWSHWKAASQRTNLERNTRKAAV